MLAAGGREPRLERWIDSRPRDEESKEEGERRGAMDVDRC